MQAYGDARFKYVNMEKWLCSRRKAYGTLQIFPAIRGGENDPEDSPYSKPLHAKGKISSSSTSSDTGGDKRKDFSFIVFISSFIFGCGDSSYNDLNVIGSRTPGIISSPNVSQKVVNFHVVRKRNSATSSRRPYNSNDSTVEAIALLENFLFQLTNGVNKSFLSKNDQQVQNNGTGQWRSSTSEFVKYSIQCPSSTAIVKELLAAYSIPSHDFLSLTELVLKSAISGHLEALFSREKILEEIIDILHTIIMLFDDYPKHDLENPHIISCEGILVIVDLCLDIVLTIYSNRISMSLQYSLLLSDELISLSKFIDRFSTEIDSENSKIIWSQIVLKQCYLLDAILLSCDDVLLSTPCCVDEADNLSANIVNFFLSVSTIIARCKHINEKIFYLFSTYFWFNCRGLLEFISGNKIRSEADISMHNEKKTSQFNEQLLLKKLLFNSITPCHPTARELMPEMIRFYNSPFSSLLPSSLSKFEIFSDSNSKLLALSSTGQGNFSHHEAWKMSRLRWVLAGLQTMFEIDRYKTSYLASTTFVERAGEWIPALSESVKYTLTFLHNNSWNHAKGITSQSLAWTPTLLTSFFLDLWLTLIYDSPAFSSSLKNLDSKDFVDFRRDLIQNMLKFTNYLKSCKKYKNLSPTGSVHSNININSLTSSTHHMSKKGSLNNISLSTSNASNNNLSRASSTVGPLSGQFSGNSIYLAESPAANMISSLESPSFMLSMDTPAPDSNNNKGMSIPLAELLSIHSGRKNGSGRGTGIERLFPQPTSNRDELTSRDVSRDRNRGDREVRSYDNNIEPKNQPILLTPKADVVFQPIFNIGDAVSGQCVLKNESKRWFPGVISGFNEVDNTYSVTFKDGDVHHNKPEIEIRSIRTRGGAGGGTAGGAGGAGMISASLPSLPPKLQTDNNSSTFNSVILNNAHANTSSQVSQSQTASGDALVSASVSTSSAKDDSISASRAKHQLAMMSSPNADRRPSITKVELSPFNNLLEDETIEHVAPYTESEDEGSDVDDSNQVFEIPTVIALRTKKDFPGSLKVPKMALSMTTLGGSSVHVQSGMSLSCALLQQDAPSSMRSEAEELNSTLNYSPNVESVNAQYRYGNHRQELDLESSLEDSQSNIGNDDEVSSNSTRVQTWQSRSSQHQIMNSNQSTTRINGMPPQYPPLYGGGSDTSTFSTNQSAAYAAVGKLKMPILTNSARSDMSMNDYFFDEIAISEDIIKTWVRTFGILCISILENCFRGSTISERLMFISLDHDNNSFISVNNSRPTSTQISTRLSTNRSFSNTIIGAANPSLNQNLNPGIPNIASMHNPSGSYVNSTSNVNSNILFIARQFLENCYFPEVLNQIASYCSSRSSSLHRLLRLLHPSYLNSCLTAHVDENGVKIGEGGFGSIFKVTCPATCHHCLHKCFDCNNLNKSVSYAVKRSSRERTCYDVPRILDIYNEISCLEILSSSLETNSDSSSPIIVPRLYEYGVCGDEYWIVSECGGVNLLEWRLSLAGDQSIVSDRPVVSLPSYASVAPSPNKIVNRKLTLNSLMKCMILYTDTLHIVKKIHSLDIVHFDLKCNNFVLRDDDRFKKTYSDISLDHMAGKYSGSLFVCDFGESIPNIAEYSKLVSLGERSSRCRGTLFIQSPEMLCINDNTTSLGSHLADHNISIGVASEGISSVSEDKPESYSNSNSNHNNSSSSSSQKSRFQAPSMPSDIWSLGSMLVELITGRHLFAERAWTELFVCCCVGEMKPINLDCLDASFESDVPANIVADIKAVVIASMAQLASDRLSIDALLTRCNTIVGKAVAELKQIDLKSTNESFSPRDQALAPVSISDKLDDFSNLIVEVNLPPTLVSIGNNIFFDFADHSVKLKMQQQQQRRRRRALSDKLGSETVVKSSSNNSDNLNPPTLLNKLSKLSQELETHIAYAGLNSINYSGEKYDQRSIFLSKTASPIFTQSFRAILFHDGKSPITAPSSSSSLSSQHQIDFNVSTIEDSLGRLCSGGVFYKNDSLLKSIADSLSALANEVISIVKESKGDESFVFVICPTTTTTANTNTIANTSSPQNPFVGNKNEQQLQLSTSTSSSPSSSNSAYNIYVLHIALTVMFITYPLVRGKKGNHQVKPTSATLLNTICTASPQLRQLIRFDLLSLLKSAMRSKKVGF